MKALGSSSSVALILLVSAFLMFAPSRAPAQTTDAPTAADAPSLQEAEAPTPDGPQPVLPVEPPKKQNQLQATSLSGAPSGAGGEGGLPGVSERAPGMAKVESSGAAAYEIAVIVSPGIVAPQLSFAYDSQGTKNSEGTNGLLGMSWALKGLRTIQRCPRTVAQDGFRGTINYDGNDRFCFEGGRLMAISGAYGAHLTEYRTEVDNFIKVISYGQAGSGPAYFKAFTKQGEVMEFGLTDDSRIEAQGKTSVRVWALNRMQDVKGNFFTVTYFEDNANGEYRPTRIDYTGNTGIDTTRSVEFTYGPRTDATLTYVGGSLINVTQLLTKVETFAPPPAGGSAVRVREYRLAYEVGTATKRSRLTSITECDGDGSCTGTHALPPTTFTWQEGGDGNFIKSTFAIDVEDIRNTWVADVNNDGKSDVIIENGDKFLNTYLSQPDGSFQAVIIPQPSGWNGNRVRVGDFDGNGRQDLAFQDNGKLHYLFSKGDGTYTILSLTQPSGWNGANMWAGDWDGDGRTDLVSHNNGKVYFAFSKFVNGAGTFTSPVPAAAEPPFGWNNSKTWIGDVNGDNKSDIITFSTNRLITMFNISDVNGSYESRANDVANGWGDCLNSSIGITCWAGDWNGDGKLDMLSHSNGDGRLHYTFSKGDGTFDNFTRSIDRPAHWNSAKVWVADINGDGRQDLVTNGDNRYVTLFSKGDGTFWSADVPQPLSSNDGVGDFINGDGKSDFLNAVRDQLTFARSNGAYPDLITSITNPFQGVNSITYKPLTDSTVYTKDTAPPFAASYPIMDAQQPIYVVSDMTLSDADNNYPFSYTYAGAKQHLLGRNFIGFRAIEMVNDSAGARNITFYNQGLNQGVSQFDQNFANIGSPQSQEIESLSCPLPNNLVVQTINEYTITTPFTGVKRLLQSTVDSLEWECGNTNQHTRRTLAFDSHGNLTQAFNEGVVGVAGDERDEQTEWVVDVTNWLHRPKAQVLKDGTGNIVRRKWLFYDKQAHGVLTGPGLLTKEEHDAGSGTIGNANNAVFEYDHDSVTGAPTSVKDARLCETTTVYDSTKTFPKEVRTCANIPNLNFLMKYEHDPRFGGKISETDWNNQQTTYEYDGFGRLTKRTNVKDFVAGSPNGTETSEYLEWGTVNQRVRISKTIEHGQAAVLVTDQFFDGLGRVDQIQADGPGGSIILEQTKFDSRNLALEKFAPRFLTEPTLPPRRFEYDALGRQTKVTHPDGRVARKVYTPGQVTAFDELDRPKTFFIDAFDRLSQVREFEGAVQHDTLYKYNPADQVIQIENSQGHLTKIEYDRLGRRRAMCDPNMGTPSDVANCTADPRTPGAWIYTYNPAGDMLTQTDAKNQTLCTSYDEMGRPISKKHGANCTTSLTTFAYDTTTIPGVDFPKGKLTQILDIPADVTTKFAYDELGRIAKTERVLLGITHVITQQFDALDRIKTETTETPPGSDTIDYTYDGPWLKSVAGYINDIQYNGRGQKKTLTYANNVVTTFTYFDQLGDTLKNFRVKRRVSSNSLQDLQYTYNAVGNLTSITDSIWTGTRNVLEYDDLNRLTHAEGTFGPKVNFLPTFLPCEYTYNRIGNLLNKCNPQAFVYGDSMHPSAVTFNPVTGKNYSYDANGNMFTRGDQTLTWDFENRVTSVSLSGATTTMEYDYTGMRVKKFAPNTSSPTQYPFKGYEIEPDGTITKFIKIGIETFASKKTPPGEQSLSSKHFYHNDHLGGVNIISDMNGVKEQLTEYDPWGSISRSEGPTVGSPPTVDTTHGFTGQEIDPETGLYYFGGRYYDAELARFISPDIVVQAPDNPQSLNHYSYVINNPVSLNDPTGFFFEELIIGAIIGATIGGIEAAITGGNVGMGILTGAVSGAIFAGVADVVGGLITQAGIPEGATQASQAWKLAGKIGGSVAGGAAAGAAASGINGGNIGQGMLTGAVMGGLTAAIGVPKLGVFDNNTPLGSIGNRLINSSIVGGALGGAYAAATGGDIGRGIWMGAATWAGGDVATSLIGHAVGFVGSGFKAPTFREGVFVYEGNPKGSITIGNAVWGSARGMSDSVFAHERAHSLFQGTLLGPAYLPAHILDRATFTFSLEYSRAGLGGSPTYNDLPVEHPPTWRWWQK